MPLSANYLSQKLIKLRSQYPHAGDFCFFADVGNAAAILRRGALLARNRALQEGVVQVDCASTSVLSNTASWVKDCARLYFAPKTPMLYLVEGIKRKDDGWPECPSPVYFVFRPDVLLLPGVLVSDGNLAASDTSYAEATDQTFDQLPFRDIYHRGSTWGLDTRAVIRRRHAEVLVPEELSLSLLRKLVFRSQAEQRLCSELLGGPLNVNAEVQPSWFHRQLHLQTFDPPLDIAVAHAATGDSLTRVFRGDDGQLHAVRSIAQRSALFVLGWSPYETVDLATVPLKSQPVNDGRNRLYLNGRRVAIW